MIPLIPNYEEEVLFVSNNSKIHKIALAITKLEYITRLIIATVILTKAEKIVKKKNNFAVAKQIAQEQRHGTNCPQTQRYVQRQRHKGPEGFARDWHRLLWCGVPGQMERG